MKPFDYYSKPQTLYPHKKDYTTFYVYDKGACIAEEKSGSVGCERNEKQSSSLLY
jgi:hypothetical protein